MSNIIERDYNLEAYENLCQAGFDDLFARILAARGIKFAHEIEHSFQHLLHFSSMKNIDIAAHRIANAIINNDKITIIADYDTDGATACAVAMGVLSEMGANVDYLVPNRFTDGYGFNRELADTAHQKNTKLIITVDNGISAIDAIDYAQSLGMEVIVTDHHLAGEKLPNCIIVNPNQPECPFPSKSLAGVGVIFYVLTATRSLLKEQNYFNQNRPTPNLANYLDLVAIGTIADIVPLDHNNRILVYQGLERIKQQKTRIGIQALFDVAKRDINNVHTFDISFGIAPRINAAGRLDDMSLGIQCLLSQNSTEALELAKQLNTLNQDRRQIEQSMVNEVIKLPQPTLNEEQYTLCVFGEDWHEGVIGIVASRLKEHFYRPTIAFSRSCNGELKGSGRSIENLHLRDALDITNKKNPNIILRFGGHAMAAGLTIREDAFNEFQATFEQTVSELLTSAHLIKKYQTDGSLKTEQISIDTAKKISEQIWGQNFVEPSFCDVFEKVSQKIVGEKHSKLFLQKDNKVFEAILFRHTDNLPNKLRLVYRPIINIWQDKEILQLHIQYWEEAKIS